MANNVNVPSEKKDADMTGATCKSSPSFSTVFSDYDFYLLGEGKLWKSYEKLGAHHRVVDGIEGVNFVVWAPNATSVSVVGDFNDWDPGRGAMHKHYPSGLWETFVPGAAFGDVYKYRVENNGAVTERVLTVNHRRLEGDQV